VKPLTTLYLSFIASGLLLSTGFPLNAGGPDASAPRASEGGDSAEGRKLFGQNCARCHGFNMLNPAPGVLDLRTFPHEDKPRFVSSVTQGKGAMPAWQAVLTAAEIDDLWSYVSAGPSS
jgi:mono/diheme cytochrome c family protein